MKTKNSIFFLLLLFLGATQAAIAMQENLDQIATEVSFFLFERDLNLNLMPPYDQVVNKVDQVVDKVEESKEKCYEGSHYLVSLFFTLKSFKRIFLLHTALRWM